MSVRMLQVEVQEKNKREIRKKKKVSNQVAQLREILVKREREIKEFLKDDDLGSDWYKNRDAVG